MIETTDNISVVVGGGETLVSPITIKQKKHEY